MAKITDPDNLVRSSAAGQLGTDGNIWVDVATKRVALLAFGSLLDDSFVEGGVSIQAVYSWLKEEWKTDDTFIKYAFPMVAITPEQFEFVDDWQPSGTSTINLFRDGGFAIKDTGGTSTSEWIGVISLGSLTEDTQTYYARESGNAQTTNAVLTGAVNQCVELYSSATFDYRSYYTIYAREQAKIYGQSDHTDIGVSTFTYQAYRFPLTNSDDLKITYDDNHISSSTTYTDIDVTYTATPVLRQGFTQGDGYFDKIIEGDGKTKEEIYEKIQYLLRQTDDIDEDVTGVVSGKTADLLLSFVGDTLVTQTGVFIDNIAAADTNAIQFYGTGGTLYTYPYVAAGIISFNNNLYNDTGAIYRAFFTDCTGYENAGDDFGTSTAIMIRSNDTIENASDISFTAASNSIHSDTTDFTLAGISVNSVVEISGTTNNNNFYTVTGVSASQLDVELPAVTTEAEQAGVYLFECIAGNISGETSASFSYDYDNNDQRGISSTGTTAPTTLVAIGLDSAQYVKTEGDIEQSNANAFSLVAALERNYNNP